MNRRQALTALAASMAAPLFAQTRTPAGKKGWCGGNAALHSTFKTHWYYTWSPKTRPSNKTEFIPMIKGPGSLKQSKAIENMSGISHLLGFNEPERKKQGNVSVEQALDLWPQLVSIARKRNLRLGSPAPSSDDAGMKWFHTFMEQAKRRNLQVDFIAFHWYRGRDAGAFEDMVKDLGRTYKRPLWVTEFNGWSGPEKEHYDFLKDALRFLEKSKTVERYAYFNPGKGKPHSLLHADGSLTRMGELYRDT